jgi:hypothetical protein
MMACVVLLATHGANAAHAQTSYKAANGPTSLVPRTTGLVRADFAEALLSLTYVHEFRGTRLGVAPYLGAAARKGETDLFGSFNFNPGFEGGAMAFLRLSGAEDSRSVVSLAAGYTSTQRRIVEFNADSSLASLAEHNQHDIGASMGVNVGLGELVMLGVGGAIRRERSSPGVTKATEVCVPGRDPVTGTIVPVCEDRYVVALEDYWAGQMRGDVLWQAVRLGSSRSRPHLAFLGSASVDMGQDAKARLNVGAGVAVAPVRYTGHTLVALFAELYDVTDANGQSPEFSDRFVTRLVLGIPFDMLVQ